MGVSSVDGTVKLKSVFGHTRDVQNDTPLVCGTEEDMQVWSGRGGEDGGGVAGVGRVKASGGEP